MTAAGRTTRRPFRGSGVTVRVRWRRWEAVGGVLALWVPAGLTAHARARLCCPEVGSDEEAMHHIYDRSSGCCHMLARQAAASPLGAQRYGYLWVSEGAGRLSDVFTAVFTPRSQRVYRCNHATYYEFTMYTNIPGRGHGHNTRQSAL